MNDPPKAPQSDYERLREMNETLLVSSVRQHEQSEKEEKARDELTHSRDASFQLVERAPFGVYVVDSQFRIYMVNSGAQAVFQNVRPLIGHDFAAAIRTIWPEPLASEVVERFRHTLETGECYIAPSLTHQRGDEDIVESYEWQTHRVTLPDQQMGVVCYFYESTKLRQTEELLRHLTETLEQRVEERTESVRRQEARIRELASQLTMAEQVERDRIAQVLHDDLQQLLYSIQVKLSFLRDSCESGERQQLRQTAAEAVEWVGEAVDGTRRLAVDLSPQVLEHEGLAGAVRWLGTQMLELHDLTVQVREDGVVSLPKPVRLLLFQVVRELLFNIVKHADVKQALVTLSQKDDEVFIQVIDKGKGFDLEALERHYGFGVLSVKNRLALVGGSIDIESRPGWGTTTYIRAPRGLGGESRNTI